MSSRFNAMLPPRGASSPIIVFSKVVLPAPLRPSTATAPCRGAARVTSNSTWLRPYETHSSRTWRNAGSDTNKIDLLHFATVLDVADCAAVDDFALVEDSEKVANIADKIEIVLDDHRGAVPFDRHQQLAGDASLFEAHSGGRFVEQEQPRLARESHGDFEPLLLTVRQCGCSLCAPLSQVELFEQVHNSVMERPTRTRKDQARSRTLRLQRKKHVVVH